MTATLTAPEPTVEEQAAPTQPYLWTLKKYKEAVTLGLLGPDDKIELIEGVIINKMPQNDPHRTAIGAMQEALGVVFPKGHWVCVQMPLAVGGRSMPEPDLAVVVGSWRDYRGGAPAADQAVLVVEISASTLLYDRTREAAMYARAGVADYWIVNVAERVLEVHRAPAGGAYQKVLRLTEADAVAPLAAASQPIAVKDLLP